MMAGEIVSLLKVCSATTALMAYARFASARTSPGRLRLLILLPSISPLFFLPLSFSSIHFRSISAFFLAWLAVFKLLLLSFNSGPLSPSLPFLTFLPLSLLPVKLQPLSPPSRDPKPPHLLPCAIKSLLLSLLIPLYSRRFAHRFLPVLYSLHIYLALEIVLAIAAFLAGVLLGFDLEPQFNAPYLSSSLRDFWGRRWNLMVSAILRPSVYGPVRERWGAAAGMVATFVVSGVMHELMFWYITLAAPTGEVSCFFVVHGLCAAAEGRVKKVARVRVHKVVSVAMTLGFVAVTAFWLFFPPVMRNGADRRAVEECVVAMRVLEEGGRGILGWLGLRVNLTDVMVW